MTVEYCRGCGSVIQSLDPNKPGYIPETVQGKKQVCQRCYQMTHYGKTGNLRLTPEQIKSNIRKAIQLSQLLVIVADFSDLAGTLPAWSDFISDKPYLIAINKLDLIPERTKPLEVVEYLRMYLTDKFSQKPKALILTSALRGNGVALLLDEIKKASLSGDRVALLGMTNVGKSSLVKGMLAAEKGSQLPTISKFPGTTLGLSNWSILKGRNSLIDTPGMAPGDRLGDLLCPECAAGLLSTAKLSHKLWGVKPGKGMIVGNYFGIANQGESEAVLLGFFPPKLQVHRTDGAKIGDLITTGPSWLGNGCKQCFRHLKWKEDVVRLTSNSDLAFAGLGWFSLRGADTEFKIWYPEGIRLEIRPAVVGRKEMKTDNRQ